MCLIQPNAYTTCVSVAVFSYIKKTVCIFYMPLIRTFVIPTLHFASNISCKDSTLEHSNMNIKMRKLLLGQRYIYLEKLPSPTHEYESMLDILLLSVGNKVKSIYYNHHLKSLSVPINCVLIFSLKVIKVTKKS